MAVLSLGPVLSEVVKASEALREKGTEIGIYDMIWVKPLDEQLLNEIAQKYKAVVTVEDAAQSGGFGSAVEEWFLSNGHNIHVERMGVPDKWIGHGTVAQLREICGFDSKGIEQKVLEMAAKPL